MGGVRTRLSGTELSERAASLSGWTVRDQRQLTKTFLFPDFKTALDFVNRVGELAEEQGHHPDLHLAWGRVDVETWTHDADGLTESDFTLAEGIDRAYFNRPS
jgi:4a-hydroxytetrahydrobiopterin dehydratase